jgi:hypothetical protein
MCQLSAPRPAADAGSNAVGPAGGYDLWVAIRRRTQWLARAHLTPREGMTGLGRSGAKHQSASGNSFQQVFNYARTRSTVLSLSAS